MPDLRSLAAVVAILAFGASGCRRSPGPPPIRVALLPFLSYAPFLLADADGDFRREGIRVEFVHLERNADATVALMAGQIDVTAGILNAVDLNALARGAGFRVVADKGHEEAGRCTFSGFVVRPDLSGPPARFRVTPASVYEFLLDRALAADGRDPASVSRVDFPIPLVPRALATHAVDGASLDEPALSRALDRRDAVLWKRHGEILPGFQFAYVTFGRALLGPRRAEGVRFLRAYLRGVARYRQGKTPGNLDVVSGRTGVSRGDLERACWPSISADGSFDPSTLDRFQDWCLARGLVRRKLTVAEIADLSLARDAAANGAAGR
ncbi:MAG TPA: ABC transporter substrate-binding protein [Thermoanaerobaculia bacterium]|nr:ABC transporter substrate-binding protein [Thermoanaerobaculia bacterium]